jgi:ubiquinone biosynthesis protein COQ9
MAGPTPLQKIRQRLALAVGENAVFDGWNSAAVDSAAVQLGIDKAQARLAFPKSQAAMIDAFVEGVDRELERRLPARKLKGMKIREKIRALVWTRLEIMEPARESVRQAIAILAMPHNAPAGLKMAWRSADLMWRLAGDSSSDFSHYTKRMSLSAVYGSTLLAWLDDNSEGWADTAAFLDRRIENVMEIERWKAGWRGRESFSIARFLGRLRYPPR